MQHFIVESTIVNLFVADHVGTYMILSHLTYHVHSARSLRVLNRKLAEFTWIPRVSPGGFLALADCWARKCLRDCQIWYNLEMDAILEQRLNLVCFCLKVESTWIKHEPHLGNSKAVSQGNINVELISSTITHSPNTIVLAVLDL